MVKQSLLIKIFFIFKLVHNLDVVGFYCSTDNRIFQTVEFGIVGLCGVFEWMACSSHNHFVYSSHNTSYYQTSSWTIFIFNVSSSFGFVYQCLMATLVGADYLNLRLKTYCPCSHINPHRRAQTIAVISPIECILPDHLQKKSI